MKKDFFFREKKTKQKNNKNNKTKTKNNNNNKKQTNKKWGTGAVRDKPFDELLMFIVGRFERCSPACENGR